MANLFTAHDQHHVHKTLGFVALLHFLYRYWRWFWYGRAFSAQPTPFDVLLICLHIALHVTSFIFAIPSKRNYTAPMIWREYRWHNTVFGCRNLILTLIMFVEGEKPDWIFAVLKWTVLMSAMKLADIVTDTFGDKDKRTISAMPFPKHLPQELIHKQRDFYAFSQFGAAAVCFFDVNATFGSVLAIQLASFFMTLVRKGKMSERQWHVGYGLALWINVVGAVFWTPRTNTQLKLMWICSLIFREAFKYRTKHRWNKYLVWTLAAIGMSVVPHSCPVRYFASWLFHDDYWWLSWGVAVVVNGCFFFRYCAVKFYSLVSWPSDAVLAKMAEAEAKSEMASNGEKVHAQTTKGA